ncbi:MAG: hypothetical protein Q8P12_07770, partial [bacterium]|nr:hypothetical protein [bacterium]
TKDDLHLFRLPFFLTLIVFIYYAIGAVGRYAPPLILLAGVWLLFLFLSLYRHLPRLGTAVKGIIACCKNW